MTSAATPPTCHLLRLPRELRDEIYCHVIIDEKAGFLQPIITDVTRKPLRFGKIIPRVRTLIPQPLAPVHPKLADVNKQLRRETLQMFYKELECVFMIRIKHEVLADRPDVYFRRLEARAPETALVSRVELRFERAICEQCTQQGRSSTAI